MQISSRRAYLLIAVLLLTGPAAAAAQSDPLAGFDEYVLKALQAWRLPGLSIAIVKDGKVVHAKGYGVREIGKPDRVDEHTLFAIGSTTKAMTAALIGMLVDEGKLAWDDPVTRHLPGFQLKDPIITRELTIRDLLTHRGGLGGADFLWYGQDTSTAEIFARLQYLDPAYSLRSRFIYQNVMYAVAGQVVEAVSGKPWRELIRERIFEQLGMRDTYATLGSIPAGANVAVPHDVVRNQVTAIENASVDPVGAAGSVWSSADDMAKWMQCLLDGGRIGGAEDRRLVSERTFAELFHPQTIAPDTMYPTTRLVRPHWMTYALGWFQQDYRGRAVDFHTGSIDGMVAIIGLIRDERLGVFVLGNLDHAELRHALMYTVFDRFADGSDRDWSAELLELYGEQAKRAAEARARIEAQRVAGTKPSLVLEQYTGTYTDPLRGEVTVTLNGGELNLRYGPGFVGRLEHWHYDTFRASWAAEWRAPALVSFVLGATTGRPEAVEVLGGRFVRVADRNQQSGIDDLDQTPARGATAPAAGRRAR